MNYATRYPHELSGGQRQRIGLARAIALEPELIIADEPTSALDVSVQAAVLEVLRSLQERMHFACLFISHDLAVVHQISDRVAVMLKGEIVETGSADDVLLAPQHPYSFYACSPPSRSPTPTSRRCDGRPERPPG